MRAFVLIALTIFSGLGLYGIPALAQAVEIERLMLGSGEQGVSGYEQATAVYGNIYHVPQYLPGFPTAATIWPRAIEVPCHQGGLELECDGYYWNPAMGRGEYLFFIPVVAVTPAAAADGASAPIPPVELQNEPLPKQQPTPGARGRGKVGG